MVQDRKLLPEIENGRGADERTALREKERERKKTYTKHLVEDGGEKKKGRKGRAGDTEEKKN